jgi:hypothetical protein
VAIQRGKYCAKKPIFGSMKERITIKDVNWWKPMTEDEVESFMDGQY